MTRKFGGKGGYGYIPDPTGHRVTHVGHTVGDSSTPVAASLTQYVQLIMDQGQSSGCTGHALVGAAETFMASIGKKETHRSPCSAYRLGRAIDRFGSILQPLTDTGAMPNEIMRAMQQWGISPYGYSKTDGPDPTQPPDLNHINDEPEILELEGANNFQFMTCALIPDGTDGLNFAEKSLAAGMPFTLAILASGEFENYDGNGPLNQMGTDPDSGHYIYCTGYANGPDGRIWEGVNSWGKGWGDSGKWTATDAWMTQTTNKYSIYIPPSIQAIMK